MRSSFSRNSFLLVLAAPSSSFISASVICLFISLLYHTFLLLAIVRCCLTIYLMLLLINIFPVFLQRKKKELYSASGTNVDEENISGNFEQYDSKAKPSYAPQWQVPAASDRNNQISPKHKAFHPLLLTR